MFPLLPRPMRHIGRHPARGSRFATPLGGWQFTTPRESIHMDALTNANPNQLEFS